jgi:uncharacterized protein (DUF305 family)
MVPAARLAVIALGTIVVFGADGRWTRVGSNADRRRTPDRALCTLHARRRALSERVRAPYYPRSRKPESPDARRRARTRTASQVHGEVRRMTAHQRRSSTAVLLAALAATACSSAARTPATLYGPGANAAMSPAERVAADGGIAPYTPEDVHFMTGMIAHHSQAVLMGEWAPTHGASEAVRKLCERIVVAQRDEIATMQQWLRARGETVPDGEPSHAHTMPGMSHATLMPGMLTPEQLAELDAARGADFDRLFLTFMIQHHQGAATMVEDLFASNGGGQDEDIFKFASDVFADQTSEIDRMYSMLQAMPGGAPRQ